MPKSIIVRNVDDQMYREFKSLCALEPISVGDKIKELMSEYVSEWEELIRRTKELNKKNK